MEKKRPKRISLSQFKELISGNNPAHQPNVYFGKGYAVALNIGPTIPDMVGAKNPIRLDELRIGLVKSGHADVVLNLIPRHLSPGMLLFFGSESILQLKQKSDDFNAEGFTVPNDLLEVLFHGNAPSPLNQRMEAFFFRPEESFVRQFHQLLHLAVELKTCYGDNSEMLFSILTALLPLDNHLSRGPHNINTAKRRH